MALDAANAAVHVSAVVEIGIVRQLVHLDPLDWKPAFVRSANRFEQWTLAMNLRVAVHARLGRRNRRERSAIHCAVAVTTIETQLSHVHCMAIWHRLHRLVSDIDRLGTEPVGNHEGPVQRGYRRCHDQKWKDLISPTRKEKSAHGGGEGWTRATLCFFSQTPRELTRVEGNIIARQGIRTVCLPLE